MSFITAASDYLEVASDVDAVAPYLFVAMVYAPSAFSTHTVMTVGAQNTSRNNTVELRVRNNPDIGILITDGTPTTITSGTANNLTPAAQWHVIAAEVRSGTYARSILNQDVSQSDTPLTSDFSGVLTAIAGASPTYFRIGASLDGTSPTGDVAGAYIAACQVWDITGFDGGAGWDTNIETLLTELAEVDGEGRYQDPRAVSAQTGTLWEGKLKHFWEITDGSDLADLVGSDDLTAVGGPAYSATHPEFLPFGQPTIASSNPATLVDGALFTISGDYHEVGGVDPTGLTWGDQAQTIGSATAGTTTATASVGVLLYGVQQDLVLTNNFSLSSEPFLISMEPATGVDYYNITQTPVAGGLLDSIPALAIGYQVRITDFVEDVGGTNTAGDIADVTVYPDGSFSVASGVTFPVSFDVSANADDGGGWSAYATQDVTEAAGANPSIIGSDSADFTNYLGDSVSIDLSTLVSAGTWAWSVNSGSLPSGWSLGAATGIITGTASVIASYGPVVIRVTGDTTHVDLALTGRVLQVPVIKGRDKKFFAGVGRLGSR